MIILGQFLCRGDSSYAGKSSFLEETATKIKQSEKFKWMRSNFWLVQLQESKGRNVEGILI